MKQCPFCAEQIQDAAVICRFCNRSIGTGAISTEAARGSVPISEIQQRVQLQRRSQTLTGGLLIALGVFTMLVSIGIALTVVGIPVAIGGFIVAAYLVQKGNPAVKFDCPYCSKPLTAAKGRDSVTCPKCKKLTIVDWIPNE